MKADELMIGDWVKCVDSTYKKKVYAQVIAIEQGQACILVEKDNCNWCLDISSLKPIPLTPEVLGKNGFSLSDIRVRQYRLDLAEGVFVIADFKSDEPYVHVCNTCYQALPVCKYVHELQHALKMCGIYMEINLEDGK